jgi:hypothetical protein
MAVISWPRRSYEAGVLLIPLDPDARVWLDARGAGELDGIAIADERLLAAQQRYKPEPVPATGAGRAVSSPLEHAIHDADVVVLLTHDLARIDRRAVAEIGDTARSSGKLLGAVVVSPGARWEEPEAHRSATTIREAVDNVVILEDDGFVLAFLQVLRGGTQDGSVGGGLAEVSS